METIAHLVPAPEIAALTFGEHELRHRDDIGRIENRSRQVRWHASSPPYRSSRPTSAAALVPCDRHGSAACSAWKVDRSATTLSYIPRSARLEGAFVCHPMAPAVGDCRTPPECQPPRLGPASTRAGRMYDHAKN